MSPYNRHDKFYEKAKREGHAARSVYKLEELDERFGLLQKGQRLVDLGCAPGSWLKFAGQAVEPNGLVLGYDLAPAGVSGPTIHARVVDVLTLSPAEIRADAWKVLHPEGPVPEDLSLGFDGLLSDLAPKTSGVRDQDQARSMALVEMALFLSKALLRPHGFFVAKLFQGRGFDELLRDVRATFEEVKILKPKATRQGSRECFVIGKGLKPPPSP